MIRVSAGLCATAWWNVFPVWLPTRSASTANGVLTSLAWHTRHFFIRALCNWCLCQLQETDTFTAGFVKPHPPPQLSPPPPLLSSLP